MHVVPQILHLNLPQLLAGPYVWPWGVINGSKCPNWALGPRYFRWPARISWAVFPGLPLRPAQRWWWHAAPTATPNPFRSALQPRTAQPQRIRAAVRTHDTLARLGGDDFTVLHRCDAYRTAPGAGVHPVP